MERLTIRQYFSKDSLKKLWHRIVLPYLILQTIIICVLLVKGNNVAVKNVISIGGAGPGSYCPYLYVQLWIIAPFLFLLLKKNLFIGGTMIFIVSIIGNVLFYFSGTPDRLESILLLRYLFLSVVAYIWYMNKDNFYWKYILPIISIFYWLFGMDINMSPWILSTGLWVSHQIPSLFYTFFMVFILYSIYNRYGKHLKFVNWLGRNSYELFLFQLIFFILPIRKYLILENIHLELFVIFVLALLFCVLPIILFDYVKNRYSRVIN